MGCRLDPPAPCPLKLADTMAEHHCSPPRRPEGSRKHSPDSGRQAGEQHLLVHLLLSGSVHSSGALCEAVRVEMSCTGDTRGVATGHMGLLNLENLNLHFRDSKRQ